MLKLQVIKSTRKRKKYHTTKGFTLAFKPGEICDGVAFINMNAVVFTSEYRAKKYIETIDNPHLANAVEPVPCMLKTEVVEHG